MFTCIERTRNQDGRWRAKRGDTHLETLRATYGDELAQRKPGDTHLHELRELTGLTLTQLLENPDAIDLATMGRTRNQDGRLRAKRSDVHLQTLREVYGLDFAAGLPGNMPLGALRAASGMSLSQMLEHPEVTTDPKVQRAARKLWS